MEAPAPEVDPEGEHDEGEFFDFYLSENEITERFLYDLIGRDTLDCPGWVEVPPDWAYGEDVTHSPLRLLTYEGSSGVIDPHGLRR